MTNIPGRSFSAWLVSVACTLMLRVSASTRGLMAVMRPSMVTPGRASLVTRTVRPVRSRPSCCWGRVKSTIDRVEGLQGDDGVPLAEYLAEVDLADAEAAAEGGADRLLGDGGADVVRLGQRLFVVGSGSVVVGLGDDLFLPASWRRAPGSVRVRSAWATAPGSWASSEVVSWRISRFPFVTGAPGSKAIFTTLPASSAATVTPWTAVSDADRGQGVLPRIGLDHGSGHGFGWRNDFLPLVDHRPDLQGLDGGQHGDENDQAEDGEDDAFLHVWLCSGQGFCICPMQSSDVPYPVRRFHHPPPRAWKSAAVSAKRAAWAWARLSLACWCWRSALSSVR